MAALLALRLRQVRAGYFKFDRESGPKTNHAFMAGQPTDARRLWHTLHRASRLSAH